MKVLVSNPSFEKETIWLPYLWGRLKSASKLDAEWLDPIFFSDSAEALARAYARVDVLLLSCYVWNWEKNIEIAKIIKQKNPSCYVIAGGPQATNTKEFDICDLVWTGEVEDVIDDLLQQKMPESSNRVDLAYSDSVYELYKNDYKRFADQIRNRLNKDPAAIWETNRGCPYKCTFCDWGSLTNSKIRRYSHETVIKDIEALADIGVGLLFNADANFGIFKEDLTYAEHLVEMKKKTGNPKSIFFSSAKNKKDITAKAAKLFYEHGMIPTLQISYQHTDDEVLAAIKRENIPTQRLKDELEEGFRNGIPLVGVVIMGNPGDTVDKWIKGLDDLLDIGFHEDIRYHDFMVLPNAPAADPAYRKQYGIKTIWKNYYSSSRYDQANPPHQFKAEFISATNTMTENDMVEIQSYTSFLVGFHTLNVTRYLAMFLKYYYDIPYSKFYKALIDRPSISFIYEDLKDHIDDYINGTKMEKSIEVDGVMVPPDFYVKSMALQNFNSISSDIIQVIMQFTSFDYEQANDLLNTQKRTIVSWWGQDKVKTKYNFIEAFRNLDSLPPNTKPYPWSLNKKEYILETKQTWVGDQIKASIENIDSFESWFYSDIHKKENIRNKMNHYSKLFK